MKTTTALAIVCAVSAIAASFLQDKLKDLPSEEPVERAAIARTAPEKHNTNANPSARIARIKMDSRGHFVTNAKINGRTIEVLVDTGATSVAISSDTARRLGISLKSSDYKHRVSTANGVVAAAIANIERIQIGRVTVRDVRAAVIQGNGLGGTLLGMSFLGQLSEFKIANRELIMRQ